MKVSKKGYKKNSKDKNEKSLLIPSNQITMKDVEFPVFGTDDTGYSQMMYPGLDYSFPGNYVYEIPMAQNGGTPSGPSKVIGGKLEISYDKDDNIYLRALNSPNWTKIDGDKGKEFKTKFAKYIPGYFDPAGSIKKIAKKAATEVTPPKPVAEQKPKNQGVPPMLDKSMAEPRFFDKLFSDLTDPEKIEQNEQEKLSSKYQTSKEYRWSPYNSLNYANKEYEKTPDHSLRYKNINDYNTQDINKVQSYLDSKGYYPSTKPLINTGDYKTPDEIMGLQKYLVQEGLAETLGLNDKNSSLSGKLDKKTLTAIEKFNKSNAKFSSGVLDSNTKDAIRNFRNDTDAQSRLNIPFTDPFDLYNSETGEPLVDKTYGALADFEKELMKKGFFTGNVNYDFSSKATDNPLIGYKFKLNESDDTQWDGCAQYLNNTVCNDIVGEDLREELGFKGDAWSISENLRAKGGKLIFAGLPERSEIALRPGDDINSYLKTTLNSPDIKGSLQTMSNNGEIKPGDVVNIFYEGSTSDTKAFNQSQEVNGRFFTTHVGVIKADNNGKLYVEHNIHKKIHKDPLQDFIDGKIAGNGKNKVSLISGITRPNYYQGVENNGVIKPEGISYYQTEYGKFNPKGALVNKDDPAGQMVSSKNVYDYLSVIEHNKDEILKDIPITDNEFGKLMRVARIIPVKETSASADPIKLNMRPIDAEGYFKVNSSVLKQMEKLGIDDEVSMGFTRLKDESNLNPKLRNALYNDDDTQLDNPVKSGIPTFYLLSKNYLYLKEVMNKYGVTMTSDQLAKLAGLGYNQSIGKIASQVIEKGGYDNYINFRRNNAGKDDKSFQYSEAVDLYDKQTMKNGGITAPGRFRNPEGNWVSKYASGGDISIPDLSRSNWLYKYQSGGEIEKNAPVSKIWKTVTGLPWSEAKNQNLTDGSFEANLELRKRLMSGEFGKISIKKELPPPVTKKTQQPVANVEKPKPIKDPSRYDLLRVDQPTAVASSTNVVVPNIVNAPKQIAAVKPEVPTYNKVPAKSKKESYPPENYSKISSRPGVSGSMVTVFVDPKTGEEWISPEQQAAQEGYNELSRSNNIDPIGTTIAAASVAAPLVRPALSYLNAPAVLPYFGEVPWLTANKVIGAAGATDAMVNRFPEIPGQLLRGEYMDAGINAVTGALDLYGANMVSPFKASKVAKQLPESTDVDPELEAIRKILRKNVTFPTQNKPLPDYMKPYLGKVKKPISLDEKIFRTFLSPKTQLELDESDWIHYDQEGNITSSKKYGGWLDNYKKGGVKSQGEGYYDYINGYSGIFAKGGTTSKENKWINKYK